MEDNKNIGIKMLTSNYVLLIEVCSLMISDCGLMIGDCSLGAD